MSSYGHCIIFTNAYGIVILYINIIRCFYRYNSSRNLYFIVSIYANYTYIFRATVQTSDYIMRLYVPYCITAPLYSTIMAAIFLRAFRRYYVCFSKYFNAFVYIRICVYNKMWVRPMYTGRFKNALHTTCQNSLENPN